VLFANALNFWLGVRHNDFAYDAHTANNPPGFLAFPLVFVENGLVSGPTHNHKAASHD
jgi:hypothetical protein